MIVLHNDFTRVRSQSVLHPSRHTTFHYCIASKAIREGGIFQGYSAASVYHRGLQSTQSFSNLPGCYRGNRPGQAFLICFHPTYPCIVEFFLSASRVASAPSRRSSKRRKHGFMSAIRSASKRRLGWEDGGIRRGSFERGLERTGEWAEGERKENIHA